MTIDKLQYPKSERGWTVYLDRNKNVVFLMTSSQDRSKYYLYSVCDNKIEKLGRGKTPTELEEKFGIKDVLLKDEGE